MAKPASADLDQLIAQLYETACSDDAPWQTMVEGLVGALGARTGWLSVRLPNGDASIIGSVGIGAEALRAYRDYYGAMDPWGHAARRAPAGAVLPSQDYVDPDALSRTELYADWVRPHLGDTTWGIGIPTLIADDARATIALHRLRGAGAFTAGDAQALSRLAPHLRNALMLRHRVGNLVAERDRALNVLAARQTAALVLDATGRVRFASPAAENLLRAQDGLLLTSSGLLAATRAEQARFDRAIARAADPATPAGTMLRLSRPSGATNWIVLIAPLGAAATYLRTREVLCLLRDPDRDLLPSEQHLICTFGLTGAEARVATAIVRGKSLEMISQEFGVSRHTVRNQTQQILSKTGVDRQVQLVRLILSLPVATE